MIRAAHRTYSNDAAKQDVKVTNEFTRTPGTPANRWRSSLRSTPKERNGTVPKPSYRNFAGKENLVDMNRAQQNGTKPAKSGGTEKKDGHKTDKKDEIADKAKRKFRENLSKFQRESKQAESVKSSPFQRSYRKDGGAVESAASAYRRSCRAPPVSRPANLEVPGRRSLRKERVNVTTEKSLPSVKNSRTKTQPLNSDRSPKEKDESDRYSTTSSARATAGSLSSRPSSASSTSTSASVSDSSSRVSSSGSRKFSRAELAMERHMERMRKATSPSSGSTFGSSPASVSNTKPKSRQATETDPLDGISATKLTFTKENLYSPPPQKTQTPSDVSDPSLSKIEEGLKSFNLGDEFLATFNLDDLDVFHTSPVTKLSTETVLSPNKSPKSLRSPSSSNDWSSVQIIEDYVFEPPKTKSDRKTADRSEIVDESLSSPSRPINRTTSRDAFPPIAKPPVREHPISPRRSETSRTVEHTPRDDDVEINCSVEEAIDTFRKLSEEIDTLKSSNFGKKTKSKAKKKDRGKIAKTPETQPKSPVSRHESNSKSVVTSSKRSAEVRTLSNATATRAGSRANGSASQTGAAQEKLGAREKREMTSPGPVVANVVEGKRTESVDRHLCVVADAAVAATAFTEQTAVVENKADIATEPEVVVIGKSPVSATAVKICTESTSETHRTESSVAKISKETRSKEVNGEKVTISSTPTAESAVKISTETKRKEKTESVTKNAVKSLSKAPAIQPTEPATSKVTSIRQEIDENANQSVQQSITVAEIDRNMSVRVQQRGKLTGMSAAEKRARLRRAVLKYQQEESSSDESVFSDGSSSDDDVSSSWLDTTDTDASASSFGVGRKKKTDASPRKVAAPARKSPQRNGDLSRDYKAPSRDATKTERSDDVSGTPDASKLKAMWETKLEERKVPVTSTPLNDVGMARTQPSVSDAKSAFEAPPTPSSPPQSERSSPPRSESGDSSEGGNKVGSMLSMWENKKGAKKSAYDASNDEAFDRNTMGRLQGAKALFHNMSKQSPTYQKPRQSNSGDASPKPNAVSGPKSVFENISKTSSTTSPAKQAPVAKQPVAKPATRVRQETISDESDFEDEDLSDVPTLSSTSSSEDEMEGGDAKVNNVRRMWENKSIKNKSGPVSGDTSREQDTKQAWDSGSNESSEVLQSAEPEVEKMPITTKPPTIVKKSPAKSNIQRKISAKKKGGRRSMTQPITGDDVSAAKELVKKQRSKQASGTSEGQDKEESSEEERVLTFAERLSYFNKVCARAPPTPEKRPKRGSLKRYNTQPVDLELVLEARRKLQEDEVTEDFAPPPSVKVDVPRDRVRKISEEIQSKFEDSSSPQVERPTRLSVASADPGDGSDRSGDESDGRKVGKLKSKYLDKLPSPEPSGRRSPVRGKLTSTGSRSPTSVRGRSPSPVNLRSVSPQSSSSEDQPQHPAEDMGKIREHEIKSTGSIRDRMKMLQKNQEEDWKRKVRKEDQKVGVKSSLGDRVNKLQENEEKWKKPKAEPVVNGGRASAVGNSNISDRLNSIMANSEGWKTKKGKQNDASQFTVKAKIKRSNVVPILPSPSMKRRVLPVLTKDEPVITIDDVTSDAPSLDKLSDVLKLARKGLEPEVIKTVEQSTTEIPDFVNEDFESFFSASTITIEHEVRVRENGVRKGSVDSDAEEPEESLPDWLIEEEHHMEYLSQLGHLKRSVQRGSRNRGSTRNPVKALAARADIKQSYTEQRSNVTKLEQQRLASRHGHGSNFTSAALAGLATRADFSKVSLRSTKKTSAFSASDYKPWQSKMLLRVKGRRRVQTRLVEPSAASLNSGDAFLLILPDKMFGWFGEFCNVIERAKVQEIADYIIHQGDMGSKATSINVIEENASSKIAAQEFWQLIGGKAEYDPSGGDEEDETYELNAEASIKTYKMVDAKLVPMKEAWGKLPAMGMLETTETYVFDFGAEMYTWQGKEVSFDDRQLAVRLARALWDQGYDYSDVGFCPFSPVNQMATDLKGPRPEWGLFARVNENLETALMQEKFEDWSNIHREIGDREKELKETSRGNVAHEMSTKTNIRPEMTKCDVQKMIDAKIEPLPVILEGMNLWRGYGEMLDEDGRGLQVVTSSVFCWKATDKNMEEVPEKNWGIFHRGDTYVVRWCYVVSSTGKWSAEEGERNKGKKEAVGRERTAYFLWTGRDSTINEKGASALMATEIDKAVGSQVVVTEGKEPPAMTQCFKGAMVTVDGKQGERGGYYSWKLFSVRGSSTDEASLHQVPCECQSLRTRTSFVAMNARQAKLVVWHGCASSENTRNIAEATAAKIQESKLPSLGFRTSCKSVELNVCEEGKENDDFNEAMLRIRRNKYCSLLEAEGSKVDHPRAWNLLPSGDEFAAEELPPVAKPLGDGKEPYPLVPEQLQDLIRPALVLFDTFDGVYLWHSSIPDDVMKGPGKRQLDINKRLAMETSIEYCKENRSECEPILIHEHHEPLPFINSFPYWTAKNDKISIEQKRLHKPVPVQNVLKTISRLTYTIEELQDTDNLPEGVEPNHLETYLSVKDFSELFGMSKDEFYKLPPWKQQNLRKEKKLY